jgi:hypothetical protein
MSRCIKSRDSLLAGSDLRLAEPTMTEPSTFTYPLHHDELQDALARGRRERARVVAR